MSSNPTVQIWRPIGMLDSEARFVKTNHRVFNSLKNRYLLWIMMSLSHG